MFRETIRRHIILALVLLCTQGIFAQRRFETVEPEEYELADLWGFTFKSLKDKVDAFWGLHSSQYVGSHLLFGFSMEGAWSTYINSMPKASNLPGGGAAGFRFVCEYQYSGFIVQTGLGVNFQQVYNNVRDSDMYHYGIRDKWNGIEFADITLKHEFRNRQDMSRNMYTQLPIYLGCYMFGAGGVGYFLTGVHANIAFWGSTKQKLEGTTIARYEPFLGVWHEMDNHGYRKEVPIERTGERLNLNFDLMLHGEVGYELTTYSTPQFYRCRQGECVDCRIRFAAFADFGILNINPKTEKVFYGVPMESLYDFPTYRMDHVFSTEDAKEFWIRNLYAGIRITVLFALPPKEKCILCDPWKH